MMIRQIAVCAGILFRGISILAQIQDPGPVTHGDFEVEAPGESAVFQNGIFSYLMAELTDKRIKLMN